MNDSYMHVDSSVIYTVGNIPGPADESEEYTKLIKDLNSQLTNCKCNHKCMHPTCSCIQRSGGLNYTSIQNLKFELSDMKDFKIYPIIECNDQCLCSSECGNRVVQKGPVDCLTVRTCEEESKGVGVFSKEIIPKNTFVCEYSGEVITKSLALKRHQINKEYGRMNYIFCLNEHSNGQITQTFIDPSYFGNIGRYINHSCEPNCQIIPVRVDTPTPRLGVFSCIDIMPDSEITFDYGSYSLENSPIAETTIPEVESSRRMCLCKSLRCRKFMPYTIY